MKKEISNPVEAYSDGGPHITILKQCNSSSHSANLQSDWQVIPIRLLDRYNQAIRTRKKVFIKERYFLQGSGAKDTKDTNFSSEQLVKKVSEINLFLC